LEFELILEHLSEIFFALRLPATITEAVETLVRGYSGILDQPLAGSQVMLKIPFYYASLAGQAVEAAVVFLELPGSGPELPGIVIQPQIPSGLPLTFPLSDSVDFSIRAGSDIASQFGVLIRPGELSVRYPFAPGTDLPQAGFGVALDYRPDTATLLLGDASATRLSMQGVTVSIDLDVLQDGLELKAALALNGLSFVLASPDQDGFLGTLIGDRDATIPIPLTIQWSSRSGVSFAHGAGFTLSQSASLSLGAVTVQEVRLALRTTTDVRHPPDLIVEAGASIGGSIGPVKFAAENIGLRLAVAFQDGNSGCAGRAGLRRRDVGGRGGAGRLAPGAAVPDHGLGGAAGALGGGHDLRARGRRLESALRRARRLPPSSASPSRCAPARIRASSATPTWRSRPTRCSSGRGRRCTRRPSGSASPGTSATTPW
jgi:hypothetical protein